MSRSWHSPEVGLLSRAGMVVQPGGNFRSANANANPSQSGAPVKTKGGRTFVRPPARLTPVSSELCAYAEIHALTESLVTNAAERVVELDLLLVEQVHHVQEYREVRVHVPACRGVERSVVIVELGQTASARGIEEPAFAPVVGRADAERLVLI